MKSQFQLHQLIFCLPVLALGSCIDTQSAAMSPEQKADSLARINAIDDDNFHRRDRERQSAAEAQRVSNIGAPAVQYHQHTTYAPSYGW